MTLTTEQLSAVETTKEFRALLKYMRAIAKAEPESSKEKFELEEGLWRYASQKTIKAIVGHIDALEFALAANREVQPSITDEAIDRIVVPLNPDGLDEEKHHCEWHLYHDRERIRKELREYFTAPPAPAVPDKPRLPPHVYRDLLDMLQEAAIAYGGTQQLRAQLSSALSIHVQPDHPHTRAAMLAQPVNSGYKLVPVEPTETMLSAAKEWTGLTDTAKVVYREMLAAAPEGGNG